MDGNTIRYYDPAQRMPGGDYDVILERQQVLAQYVRGLHLL